MNRKVAIYMFILGAWAAPIVAQTVAKGPQATKTYNPAAETTITGTIRHVVGVAGTDGTVGVHLDITTPAGLQHVHLGPAMFIGMNNMSFLVDEDVEVVGSKVLHDGEVALWARTIKKGSQTLVLRNDDGSPRWPNATAEDPDGCGVSHAPVR
jgi:hypothetical protein